MKKIWKKIYIHLIAVVIFILIPFIYLSPALEGKAIRQYDIIKATGAARELQDFYEKTGETALWTNSMFGGMPSYQITMLGIAKNNIYQHATEFIRLNLPQNSVDIIFLYLLGFYILLIALGVNPWLSIVGAIAFAFSSYNFLIIEAGHANKAFAIAFMPPVLGGVILAFRKKLIAGFVLTTFFLGLHIYYMHVQMTYYLLIMIILYAVVELALAIRRKQLKSFVTASGVLGIAALLAVLPNMTRLWTTYEYSQETIRGGSELASADLSEQDGLDKEYALAWSYGKAETFTLLIPNFHGGASTGSLTEESNTYQALVSNGVPQSQATQFIQQIPTYWGDQPVTGGPTYFGAIVCFLFIAGLFLIKGSFKWWILAVSVLSILLSWGENFMWFTNIFFEYAPLYNKFRAVASILVTASIAFPLMAILTIRELRNENVKKTEKLKALQYGVYIAGGLCLLFAVLGGAFFDFRGTSDAQLQAAGYPDWLIGAIQKDRASLLRADAFRSLIFIVLAFFACWALIKEKIKLRLFIPLLGLLILIDLWAVDKRYLNNADFQTKRRAQTIEPTQADLQILQDKDPNYRVFNLTQGPFQETYTSYFHKSIGGYHGAKLSRYQDLIERHLSRQNMDVLNMLNTKYFIVPGENNQPVVKRNPNALGNAWFVDSIRIVHGALEEIEALDNFDPRKTAVVDERFMNLTSETAIAVTDTTAKAAIALTEYRPHRLTYKASTDRSRLAVFSEIYYNDNKGWKAYINGQATPHLRVNYVLRGLVIPEGEHTIEFKFEPKSFYAGQRVSLIGSILAGISLVGLIGFKTWRTAKSADA